MKVHLFHRHFKTDHRTVTQCYHMLLNRGGPRSHCCDDVVINVLYQSDQQGPLKQLMPATVTCTVIVTDHEVVLIAN